MRSDPLHKERIKPTACAITSTALDGAMNCFSQHTLSPLLAAPLRRAAILRFIICLLILPVCSSSPRIAASHSSAHSLSSSVRAAVATAQDEIQTLDPSAPLRRKLAGGETHLYRITLARGQYLRVVVDQQGIDVVVSLAGPDKQRLVEVDSPNGNSGPEPLSVLAEASGEHLIEVRSPNKQSPAGFYEIKVEALREPTASDRTRVNAERTFREAYGLFSQPAAKSRQEAIQKFETVLPVWRSLEDKRMEALTLNLAALGYHASGDLHKALAYYTQSLALSKALKDDKSEAVLLNNIGGVYDILGEPQKSLAHYDQAFALWQALNNSAGQGDTLNNIGVIYFNLGELQKALEYYNRALPLRKGGNPRKEADTLDNMSLVYQSLGESQQALDYFQQALERRQAAQDIQGEANTLDHLGFTYAETGDLSKALLYYNRALPLRRTAGDRRGEAITLNHLGAISLLLNQPEKALESHQQALQLLQAVGDRRGEAVALTYLGRAHALAGQQQKAAEYFKQALSLSHVLEDQSTEAWIHQSVAVFERDRGHLDEARAQIEGSLSIVEKMRAGIGSQQLRTSFLATKQDAYEFYVDLLMRMHRQHPADGYDAAALQISERARARSLLEILSEAHIDIRQGVDATLLERERTLAQTLHARTDRLMRLLGQQNTQAPVASLHKEISVLEAEFQDVQGAIRRKSPRYAAITQPTPLGLKELQQLLDQDTVLLEYSLGAERSYLWAVGQSSLTSYELPGRGPIEKAARQVYNLVTSRSSRRTGETLQQRRERINKAEAQLSEAVGELGEMALGPVATVLGNKRLLIVADGALQYIPFSMLPVSQARRKLSVEKSRSPTGVRGDAQSSDDYLPLIIEHEIINLPSASTLAVLRREMAGRKMAPQNIAVIADPVFESTDERVRSTTKVNREQRQDKSESSGDTRILEHLAENSTGQMSGATGRIRIPRLPYTRLEANRILQAAPGATNLRAVDFGANREMATSGELHKYRYIHFATHGYIDSEKPELSAVVLSLVNERGERQDGFLRTQEIYNLNLPAELVVLSSCQTGLGKQIKGEGLVGLTRGFMYAGAARVIVSLWNVSDRGTADLMWRLYQGMLREGQRPAAALRSAQLAMLRQKRWQSPYYWAAFIQQGEWK